MSAPLYRPDAGRPGLAKRTQTTRNAAVIATTAFTLDVMSADKHIRHLRAIFGVLTEDQQQRVLKKLGWERIPVAIPPQKGTAP